MAYGTINAEQLTTQSGYTLGAGNASSFKNRIINGAMVVNQRALGTQTQNGTGIQYPCDRFYVQGATAAGVFTSQISTDAPAGFNSSILLTVTTASAPTGTQVYRLIQRIEGYNTANLNLGTANAQALTLSFWVKASVTGTFGGSLWGGGATAWFPFSYTINSANTWEQKTVSIGAATTAPSTAFDTTNGTGLQLTLNIGAGSGAITTAGSWIYGATEYYGATGQTNLIATNGATFYVTGVQLEVGTVATSFDYRSIGTELALCQRYCINYRSADSNGPYLRYAYGECTSTTNISVNFSPPVQMRSIPSLTTTGTAANYAIYSKSAIGGLNAVPTLVADGSTSLLIGVSATIGAATLTQGSAGALMSNNNNTSFLLFSAEL